MIKNSHWHQHFLTATSIIISSVTIYSFIDSDAGNRPVSKFTFPKNITISTVENIRKKPLKRKETSGKNDVIRSANRYSYQNKDTRLDIEMYYVTDTRGDVNSFLLEQTEIVPEAIESKRIEQQDDSYYSLFSDRDRTYLSTCLNPTGNSTVTSRQFSQSLDRRPLSPKLLKDWLLGKASIRDRRCLFMVISIPHNNSSFIEPEDILKQAWQKWNRWWQLRFPPL